MWSVSTSSWYLLLSSADGFLRGERTVNHVLDKNISKGHRQPLRLWDGKERLLEAQNWHHDSTRSFHNRAGNNNSYPTGPGDRYVNWNNNGNSVVRPANPKQYNILKEFIIFLEIKVCYHLSFFITTALFSFWLIAWRSSPASQQQRTSVTTGEMGPLRLSQELPRQNDERQASTLEKASPPPAARPTAPAQSTSTAPFIPEGRVSGKEEKGLWPWSGKFWFLS